MPLSTVPSAPGSCMVFLFSISFGNMIAFYKLLIYANVQVIFQVIYGPSGF